MQTYEADKRNKEAAERAKDPKSRGTAKRRRGTRRAIWISTPTLNQRRKRRTVFTARRRPISRLWLRSFGPTTAGFMTPFADF